MKVETFKSRRRAIRFGMHFLTKYNRQFKITTLPSGKYEVRIAARNQR